MSAGNNSRIPDPSTFIGNECVIVLKKGPRRVFEKVLAIDTGGVKVERPGDGSHVYGFNEIAMMNLKSEMNKR